MGNSQGRESRQGGRHHQHGASRNASNATDPNSAAPLSSAPDAGERSARPANRARASRGGRPDLSSFLGLASLDREAEQSEQRRETRQERDARKLEREKAVQAEERERSLKTEGVDGGYLVTLGVYSGLEDFSKPIVRQLQIERRLAPFWKGLNDHEDSWTEHQLVAAVRGLPIPAADEIPPNDGTPPAEDTNQSLDVQKDMFPITARSQSMQSDASEGRASRSQSQSGFGFAACAPGPLLRARAKTLASLATSSRSNSTTQLAPQEIQLPRTGRINGQPLEAILYKDASECPICFLFYPPYLNRTRCCDQPICSECFVQIKRPDPHPPDHHGAATAPTGAASADTAAPMDQRPPEEQAEQLVSEPAQCPFCVQPEFGVTYNPPPFRSGLVYTGATPTPGAPGQPGLNPEAPGMASTASLGSAPVANRRRTTSLSATAPSVITTDRVRPDWSKKLSDARAHVLRRSAAATALHTAAYVLGGGQNADARSQSFGRRRRTLFGDAEAGPTDDAAAAEGADPSGRRISNRRGHAQEIEDMMVMEAIRLSLAAEEDRKRKEEKEAKKQEKQQAKEEAKQAARQAKEAKREAKKASRRGSLYAASTNASTSTWASGQGRPGGDGTVNASPLASPGRMTPLTPNWPLAAPGNKGKGPAGASAPTGDAQRNTPNDNATYTQPPSSSRQGPTAGSEPSGRSQQRQLSSTSSMASSVIESPTGSFRNEACMIPPESGGTDTRSSTPTVEPMLNFQSLAAMIGREEKNEARVEQIETDGRHVSGSASARDQSPSVSSHDAATTLRGRSSGEIGAAGVETVIDGARQTSGTRAGTAITTANEPVPE